MSRLGKAVSTVVVSGLLWGCHGLAEGARPAGPAPSAPALVDAPAPASVSPAASAPAEAAPGASARAPEAPSCPDGMALIPAGSFSMGALDLPGARRAGHDERVESFCLDIFEVGSSRHAAGLPAILLKPHVAPPRLLFPVGAPSLAPIDRSAPAPSIGSTSRLAPLAIALPLALASR